MATYTPPLIADANAAHATKSSNSQRLTAMFLALIFAVVLSPLYVGRRSDYMRYETRLGSGLVLPAVLAGLIIAIRTTSGAQRGGAGESSHFPSPEPSWVLRIGGSSWGLAGVLVLLMLVLSWQDSVQHFFWK